MIDVCYCLSTVAVPFSGRDLVDGGRYWCVKAGDCIDPDRPSPDSNRALSPYLPGQPSCSARFTCYYLLPLLKPGGDYSKRISEENHARKPKRKAGAKISAQRRRRSPERNVTDPKR
ncbi:hypothetical protein Bbelb_196030 [Branchiostoma belcheri]|nr:hypothetical protein Bbelb_196030 [Branchiostoma belcheri]